MQSGVLTAPNPDPKKSEISINNLKQEMFVH
jgi:hypothetical protein